MSVPNLAQPKNLSRFEVFWVSLDCKVRLGALFESDLGYTSGWPNLPEVKYFFKTYIFFSKS